MERIAIVGGGFSGLSAAYYLTGNCDRRVSVLEADHLFGGRVMTIGVDGLSVDIGAQFLTKEDREVFRVLVALDLEKNLRKINMQFSFHDGCKFFPLSASGLIKNSGLKEKLEFTKLFAKIKVHRDILDFLPADDIGSEYTTKTFSEWYEENIGVRLLWLFDSMFRSIGFVDSGRVSALYGLLIVRALFEQCFSFDGGLSMLTESLVKTMQGTDFRVGCRVDRLDPGEFDKYIVSVPFPEAKKMVGDLKGLEIEYSSCTYVLLQLNKRLWKRDWAIFPSVDLPLSFVTDESLKFGFNGKEWENSVLGVIIPKRMDKGDEKAIKYVLDNLNRMLPVSEEDIVQHQIFSWEYALPVCSPEFHRSLHDIRRRSLDNIFLCGDYMSLPSLDGAVHSGRLAAEALAKK